jgi:ferredoxin
MNDNAMKDRAMKDRAMRVVVDRVKCTGLGICEAAAPAVFEIDDEGDLVILREQISPEQLDEVKEAVLGCPTAALKLVAD